MLPPSFDVRRRRRSSVLLYFKTQAKFMQALSTYSLGTYRSVATTILSCLLRAVNQPGSSFHFISRDPTSGPSSMGNCFSAKAADGPSQPYAICFVLGGPGSGKGTQSARLVEAFGAVHLSAGDLLRAHIKSGTADGNMVAEMIKQGQIVPSEITVGLLEEAMKASGERMFLIDGFPRNDENRERFESQTGMTPKMVLFFDCSEEVMTSRLMGRNEGRTDDNIETIKKRFKVFKEDSMPVVAWYERQGKVARISAARSPDEVFGDVKAAFKKMMGV